MSDRYETPSWGDEPDDLATRTPVAGEPREPLEPREPIEPHEPNERSAEVGEEDLEASSENVLDGWPATDPNPVPAEASSSDEAPAGDSAPPLDATPAAEPIEIEAPEQDDLTEAPVPLADHVSDSVEHAPGELTVPPGYSVLAGIPNGERRAV